MLYFIIDADGNVGHPTKKADMIRRWLKTGRAKIKDRGADWMILKITKKIDREKTIPCQFRIGIDPGYLNIGYAIYKVTETKIEKMLIGEAQLRTDKVTENMTERKMYRTARRHYRRENVLRKFGACKFRKPVWKNRGKHPWQPTHTHLINSHLNVVSKLFKIVPKDESHIVFEYAKFDSHKLINPTIKSWMYQEGPCYGFENVKNYVRARDGYTCQVCKMSPDVIEAHHIIPRSKHGTDTPENMICLCEKCHKKVQNELIKCPKIAPKLFVVSGVLNSVTKEIYKRLEELVSISKTYGYVTDASRKFQGLEKTHGGDASIIAFCDEDGEFDLNGFDIVDSSSHMMLKQFRRHVRNWIKRVEDRKYYQGEYCVAWNRARRESQAKDKDGLVEFRQAFGGKVIAKPGITRFRKSNTQILFRPGDLITVKRDKKTIYDVCQGWASTHGAVISLKATKEIPKRFVRKTCNNSGLVIV